MNVTNLSEIETMLDGVPVLAVEGVVKFAGDLQKGVSAKTNTPWSRQFFVLAQNGAEVGVTLWDAEGNAVEKGQSWRFENTQNKKKQWAGITKSSYVKEGKLNHTLEMRANSIKMIKPNGEEGDESCRTTHTSESHSARGSAGPTGSTPSADGVKAAREHLMQSANLLALCIDCANAIIGPKLEGISEEVANPAMFQSVVKLLFEEASGRRCTNGTNWWSYIDGMPCRPIKKDAEPAQEASVLLPPPKAGSGWPSTEVEKLDRALEMKQQGEHHIEPPEDIGGEPF